MNVVIAGGGELGFHLAKVLAIEAHDVVLIEKNSARAEYIASQLDISVVTGNLLSFSVLENAHTSKADIFVASTSLESVNIATCALAKKIGAKRTVARIEQPEFFKKKKELKEIGVDEIISPELLAAREIRRLLKSIAITDIFEFDEGLLNMLGIVIEKDSVLNGVKLKDTNQFNPNGYFIVIAILRKTETIIPKGDTMLLEGDHVYFLAVSEGIPEVLKFSKVKQEPVKDVMVIGGTKIGYYTARRLWKFKVKLIEENRQRCEEIVDSLDDHILLCNGSYNDMELLKEENIENMDAFIAVTDNTETNIVSCLLAKRMGVPKTIALVGNIDYIHLSQNIGVDAFINKKHIAVNFITRYVRKGEIVSLMGIHGTEGEVVEFVVTEKSKINGKKTLEMNFPNDAILGGVVRDNKAYVVHGDFQFKTNDRVVVISKYQVVRKIEKLFA